MTHAFSMNVVPCCFLWLSFEEYEIQGVLYNQPFFCVSKTIWRLIAVLPFAHAVNQFIVMLSYRGTCVPSGLTMDLVEEMLYVWACLVTSSMIAFPTSGLHCRFLQG